MGILAPSDPALAGSQAGSEAGLQARAIGIRWTPTDTPNTL